MSTAHLWSYTALTWGYLVGAVVLLCAVVGRIAYDRGRKSKPPRIVAHVPPLPAIVAEHFAWSTPTPQVRVTAHGLTGSISVCTYPATPQGLVQALYYGQSLANILRCPFYDRTRRGAAV